MSKHSLNVSEGLKMVNEQIMDSGIQKKLVEWKKDTNIYKVPDWEKSLVVTCDRAYFSGYFAKNIRQDLLLAFLA